MLGARGVGLRRRIQGKVLQNARKVGLGGIPLSDLGGVRLQVLVGGSQRKKDTSSSPRLTNT